MLQVDPPYVRLQPYAIVALTGLPYTVNGKPKGASLLVYVTGFQSFSSFSSIILFWQY